MNAKLTHVPLGVSEQDRALEYYTRRWKDGLKPKLAPASSLWHSPKSAVLAAR